ncbi:MAG: hypothetical protein CR982_08980 [Candidatus Cloacimonadota bacterium]|nr:MAG: hypothetical protein CR982_08980 [Candidatus Cloacimonadota bacterium]PIE78599.1 MAG: hypothetical protein CSA15_06875 [Candidatus Delongbacteria bacterium]
MKRAIKIQAGKKAIEKIEKRGFSQDLITGMLGASGGPKWLILSELDKYLSSTFFKYRETPLHLLGSSVGSWRFAAYAGKNPEKSIEIFRDSYTNFGYRYKDLDPAKIDIDILSKLSIDMLHSFIKDDDIEYIVNNPIFRLNIISAKCRGILKSENRISLSLGLGIAALTNAIDRNNLKYFFKRALFYSDKSSPFYAVDDMPTEKIRLSKNNLLDSLMASGSIPLVTYGVKNIEGTSRKDIYRDGGIIDYHFDIDLNIDEGIVLYPHFYDFALPGWFDKLYKKRKLSPKKYENIVMISPSKELMNKLPNRKLTDRKDFQNFDFDTRIKNWKTVIDMGRYMVDDFSEMVEKDQFLDRVKQF